METLIQLGLLLLMFFQNGFTAELTSVIQTDKGLVQGQILKTVAKSISYSAFKGIPYGKPPVGNLRFEPPKEPESWQNVLNATSEPNQCSQIDFIYKNFSGSEDCLYLNVYTPKTKFDGPTDYKPVMVWIYGGTFRNGYINSSLYGPDYLLEHDVLVVAMNYRVGPLGFLALDLPEASGNTGLKDQNMALRWVQKNIAKFGGDPNSVTIFGQSAGAVAVDLHVLSDLSRGLFHRAIAMSGSPLCPWGFARPLKAKARAFELGTKLGIYTTDAQHLLRELQKLPARDIINAAHEMYKIDPPFKPTIESQQVAGNEAFITECTVNKYKSGNFNRVPYITGFTNKETIAFAGSVQSLVDMVTFSIDSFSTSLIRLPGVNLIPFLETAKGATVKTLNDINYGLLYAAILESTDLMFVTGIDTKQALLSHVDDVPVYYYRLSFDTEYSLHKLRGNITLNGTAHEDDIPYIFHADDLILPTDPQNPVVVTRNRMTKMWANFAKYGNPTPDGEKDQHLKIVWPISGSSGTHLTIGEELSVEKKPIDGIFRDLKSHLTVLINTISGCPSSIFNQANDMIDTLENVVLSADLSDVIKTTKGPVQGEILQTVVKSVSYASFRGIPYAKPPIGYRRFKPPEEIDAWSEILNATADPELCPQISDNVYKGNEDCLYLNVYTPKTTTFDSNNDDLLSVMVWIYGGAFTTGTINSTYYGPDFLIENGVIMVAMNYRIGALGFLSLNHSNATGNAGLKDQVLALKWVQDNIQKFGGNPTKVTIFGESAGSVAVELHKISNLSKGLYRSSIAMSGSPLNFWGFHSMSQAVSRAFYLGRVLGLFTVRKIALLKKLYNASAKEIVEATEKMILADLKYKPTYENKNIAGDAAFLTECPIQRYKSGKIDGLPHILGFYHSETVAFAGIFLQFKSFVDMTLENVASKLNSSLSFMKILNKIADKNIDNFEDLGTESLYDLVNVMTNIPFIEGIDRTQQYLVDKSSVPIYYYRNSFDYNTSLHRVQGVNLNGTGHADDLAHIFWMQNLNQSSDPNSDIGVHRAKMVRLFTNFAKYEDPTPDGTDDTLLNIKWTASGSEGNYLEITKNLTMGIRPTDETVKSVQQSIELLEKNLNGCTLLS